MADYYPLIARAIAALDPNAPGESRRALYERARTALIAQLRETPIPLRVYGPWEQLNYQLQVDQLLRKKLQDRAKDALNKWAEKNKGSQDGQDLKKLLDKL